MVLLQNVLLQVAHFSHCKFDKFRFTTLQLFNDDGPIFKITPGNNSCGLHVANFSQCKFEKFRFIVLQLFNNDGSILKFPSDSKIKTVLSNFLKRTPTHGKFPT